jgi:hypothetical protein
VASIHERTTRSGRAHHDVRWRGPDLDVKGRLREHSKGFTNLAEAEAFLAALPEVRQIPARCNCTPARWILVDKTVLGQAEILCRACGASFQTQDFKGV